MNLSKKICLKCIENLVQYEGEKALQWDEEDEILWQKEGMLVCPYSTERINIEEPDLTNCVYHLEQIMEFERNRIRKGPKE